MSNDEETELEKFIDSALLSVDKALEKRDYRLHYKTINFDIAVIKTKEAKGKFKIFVAEASGKYDKELVTRMKFEVVKGREPKRIEVSKG